MAEKIKIEEETLTDEFVDNKNVTFKSIAQLSPTQAKSIARLRDDDGFNLLMGILEESVLNSLKSLLNEPSSDLFEYKRHRIAAVSHIRSKLIAYIDDANRKLTPSRKDVTRR